jgi:hypothetical protein
VEVWIKFVPFTMIVPPGGNTPTGVLDGDSEVIVGIGLFAALIVKVAATRDGPPGNGFTTVICGKPTFAIYAAGIGTESCVVFALYVTVAQVVDVPVVVTQLPFQNTWEVVIYPFPDNVSVNDAPPAVALSGESEVITGVGMNVVPPPQFASRIIVPIDKASAARRKRINPCLLYAPRGSQSCSLAPAGIAE